MMKGPVQLPGPETKFLPEQHEPGDLEESFQVSAGDVLYIPRGIMHHAVASESDAVHITIGVFWTTYGDVAVDLLKHLVGRQAELRASIPRNWRTSPAVQQQVLAEIHKHIDAVSVEEIGLVLTERWLDLVMTRQPLISDQLEQLRRRDEIKPSTQFRVRQLALWHQSVHNGQAVVYCYGREIAFPSHIGSLLEALFRADGIVTINALLKEIESADWTVVVQRLLAEGLLELV
jgi:ribosomal protein L16 Arg81 hydroxylase